MSGVRKIRQLEQDYSRESMMKAVLLKINPNTRFHFGKVSIDRNTALTETDDMPHSDFLFSALVNNFAQSKPESEINGFVQAFEKGDILISSGFYCLQKNGKTVFLLPRPVTAQNMVHVSEMKEVKKIRFICPNSLNTSPDKWNNYSGNFLLHPKTYSVLGLDIKTFKNPDLCLYHKDIATHVGIHKADEDAEGPFKISYIQIPDLSRYDISVYFYFLYEFSDNISKKQIDNFKLAANLIAYNGLGGKRSSGYGKVQAVEFVEKVGLDVSGNGLKMTLGKVIPAKDELKNFHYYTCQNRGGRKSKDGTLKSINMINEGAIMHTPVEGTIVDLHDSPPYKRFGKCFSIPILEFYNPNKL